VEARTGPILHEALRRYRSDAVPSWNTLYGTNLARKAISDPEALAWDIEWTSITGDCWKIPNDNRVSFCFLAAGSETKQLFQVRNFLFHFHKHQDSGRLNGEHFNVWDWFDTGISAYWFPGKRTPSLPPATAEGSVTATSFLPSSNITQLSHLVAPWRRIM